MYLEKSLNMEKVYAYALNYETATGVRCSVIDSKGNELHHGKIPCELCEKLAEAPELREKCTRNHLYGAYQAERFGGKYVFFCHMGLAHYISPVTEDGFVKGALLAGPIILSNEEELLPEDILGKHPYTSKLLTQYESAFLKIPVISTERTEALSEVLYAMALHVSYGSAGKYESDRKFNEMQGAINEYILSLKKDDAKPIEPYPINKEKELVTYITMGNIVQAKKVLNEIFGHIFFSSGKNFNIIKARVLELVVVLSRAAVEGGGDMKEIFGMNYVFLNDIHNLNTVEELTEWLTTIMQRFTDCVFDLTEIKHVDALFRSLNYINNNYMKKFSLEDVASYSYLSPTYFSRIFKEEMKCTFNTYVNKVRIEMAKKHLANDQMSLSEISELVGFENQSYFSKVFVKMTGVSPGKFRESKGRIYKTPKKVNE